jgi:hypothetical protein
VVPAITESKSVDNSIKCPDECQEPRYINKAGSTYGSRSRSKNKLYYYNQLNRQCRRLYSRESYDAIVSSGALNIFKKKNDCKKKCIKNCKSLILEESLGKLSLKKREVIRRFKQNEIVPDLIDTAPENVLFVQWESKSANLKQELTPTEVKNQPKVTWDDADSEKFYTLIMADPDEFTRAEHTQRSFQHWIVGNIPGNDTAAGNLLTAYVGSGPPQDGGIHRYVFLLFQQQDKINFDEPKLLFPSPTGVKDRVKFNVRDFVRKYNLGNPTHGNFYFAQWDDSVPSLLAQLGG